MDQLDKKRREREMEDAENEKFLNMMRDKSDLIEKM